MKMDEKQILSSYIFPHIDSLRENLETQKKSHIIQWKSIICKMLKNLTY